MKADARFGLYTTAMMLVKSFVQAGAAGVHLDDLFPGAKWFDGKDDERWTIVPFCDLFMYGPSSLHLSASERA